MEMKRGLVVGPIVAFFTFALATIQFAIWPLKVMWELAAAFLWKVKELVKMVTSTIPCRDLIALVLDPVAMNLVSKAHIKAMHKEQLSALHFHPPAPLDDTAYPRDYRDGLLLDTLHPGSDSCARPVEPATPEPSDHMAAWLPAIIKEAPHVTADPAAEAPWVPMTLTELEVAYGHALAPYGDISPNPLLPPVQSRFSAILKYTQVPQSDVLVSQWKSQAGQPVHYMAVDHKAQRVVVSIRGSVDIDDLATDFTWVPVFHKFAPDLRGYVHAGEMRAATHIFHNVREAVHKAPAEFPILVTGHSLGGATAALVAMLFRTDAELALPRRLAVRAVCLAPNAVTDEQLSKSCRHFVTSVILRHDVFPRVHMQSMASISQVTSVSTPLRSTLRAIRWLWGMGESLINTGSLEAPRLYPPGAILWLLPALRQPKALLQQKHKAASKVHQLRYVHPHAFDRLLVFQEALLDHTPARYMVAVRAVIAERRRQLASTSDSDTDLDGQRSALSSPDLTPTFAARRREFGSCSTFCVRSGGSTPRAWTGGARARFGFGERTGESGELDGGGSPAPGSCDGGVTEEEERARNAEEQGETGEVDQ